MASDLQVIMPKLVRSGMWSGRDNLCRFKHLILDADSIATHLFRLCVAEHVRRQRSILSTNQPADLYSASIVNYADYCGRIGQLFRFLRDHHIEPVVVYSGLRNLESHLYESSSSSSSSGQAACGAASSKQRVGHRLGALISYDREQNAYDTQLDLPPLAMNLFKAVVINQQQQQQQQSPRATSGAASKPTNWVKTSQAYYGSFPLMAKLARDLKCPVLTNECDFLLMDVRAGFILFDDLWLHHVELHNLATGARSQEAANHHHHQQHQHRHHHQQTASLIGLERSSRVGGSGSPGGGGAGRKRGSSPAQDSPNQTLTVDFHYNRLFLRQHPGLTPETCLYLFPLSSADFVTTYAAQLKKIRLYDSQYERQDFLQSSRPLSVAMNGRDLSSQPSLAKPNSSIYRQYHKAARRLELALSYLCGQESIVLENYIKGDQTMRSRATGFGADFRHLVAKQAVAHKFTQRLQFVLRRASSSADLAAVQLDYLQACLVKRECTATYLLELIQCSVGGLACLSYNPALAFEDLRCKRSAHAVGNRARSLLMSLLARNSPNQPNGPRGGSLTVVDREGPKLASIVVDRASDCRGAQLDSLRGPLRLAKLAAPANNETISQKATAGAAIKFISQAFMAPADMRQLPDRLEAALSGDPFRMAKEIRLELAIVRSAFRFCIQRGSVDDTYFKRTYSTGLERAFEVALVNHYIYVDHQESLASSRAAAKRMKPDGHQMGQLVALIHKRDLENVAQPAAAAQPASIKSSTSSTGGSSSLAARTQSKPASNLATAKSTTSSTNHRRVSNSKSNSTSGAGAGSSSSSELKPTTKLLPAPKSSRPIRHLIEMLNAALASYYELNAFFAYPMPQLRTLVQHYNPILLYNLCLMADDKALFQLLSG